MWNKGDVYKCPDPGCGCEITITQQPQMSGGNAPMCTCGSEMQLAR